MADERKDHARPAATAESDDGSGFLDRWSRRKQAEREAPPAEVARPEEAADAEDLPPAEAEDAPIRLEDLPDIESLDEHSDFTVFLKKGVPDALRRQALQRLWRSNPIFANLDGLAEYDEDYSLAASAVESVKSLFQTGKGMRAGDEDEVPAEGASVEDTAAATNAEDRDDTREPAAEAQGTSAEAPDDGGGEDPVRRDDAAVEAQPKDQDETPPRPTPGSAARRRWGALES